MEKDDIKLSTSLKKKIIKNQYYNIKEKNPITFFIIELILLSILFLVFFQKTDQIRKIEKENHYLNNSIYKDLNKIDILNKQLNNLQSSIDAIKNNINENEIKHSISERKYIENSKKIDNQNDNINSLISKNYKKKIQLNKLIKKYNDIIKSNNSSPEIKNIIEEYEKKLNELIEKYQNITKNKMNFQLGKSLILLTYSQYLTLTNWIFPGGDLMYNLIYSSTYQDLSIEKLKNICFNNDLSNILMVILTEDNEIIGGFTFIESSKGGYRNDKNAFLFNLNNTKRYLIKDSRRAIYSESINIITFGTGDLTISDSGVNVNFPQNFGDENTKENEITNGKSFVKIKIIEIFYLFVNYNDVYD